MDENLMILIYVFAAIGFWTCCCVAGTWAGILLGRALKKLGWLR